MNAFLRGMWRRRPWVPVLVAAIAADVGVRYAFHFDQGRVLPVEAGIFGAASAFVLALSRRPAPMGAGPRRGECALAAVLGLGALRSLLWGSGVAVWEANVIVLALTVILAVAMLAHSRPAPHLQPRLRLE